MLYTLRRVFQKTIVKVDFKMKNLIYSRVSMFRKLLTTLPFIFFVLAMQSCGGGTAGDADKTWRRFSRLVMFLKRLRMAVIRGTLAPMISGKFTFCCGGE